jgi:steroid 5-alpha reductase family enzyme
MNAGAMILIGWVAMALAMAAVWVVQRRTGDAGVVDVAWTFGVGILGATYAILGGDAPWERRLLVAALILLWALRLGSYIAWRVWTQPEDGRYVALKRSWGAMAQRKLFVFFQYQAIGAVLFAVPMLFAARNRQPVGWLDGLGAAIWLIAIVGEGVADRQLAAFRRLPKNRGDVCRSGLWRYSRHPNYFFEWLHWWSYVAIAWLAPWGWATIFWPMMMLYFILRVTGIPPTEAQAVLSRGEAYREYQRSTSSFFPWFPRKSHA